MSKFRIFNKDFWTVDDVKNRPNCLFIFGDNNVKLGCGGQAIIRGLPNVAGIPTKKYPNNNAGSFYSDNDFDDNASRIKDAINHIITRAKDYQYIVYPKHRIGTGLSKLKEKAPRTYAFLLTEISRLKKALKLIPDEYEHNLN